VGILGHKLEPKPKWVPVSLGLEVKGRFDCLTRKMPIPYNDLRRMSVSGSRYKSFKVVRVLIIFLSVLTISLPFVHLHPPLTHADDRGEHTHSAVAHTIFSPDGGSAPFSPRNSIHSEDSGTQSEMMMTWRLSTHRSSASFIYAGSPVLWLSFPSNLSHLPQEAAVAGDADSPLHSAWIGPILSSRAPPGHSLS